MRRALFCLAALFMAAACNQQPRIPTAATESGEPEWSMPSFAIAGAGSSTAVNIQSGEGSLTIPTPDDVAEGDFLLAQVSFEKGSEVDFTQPGTVPTDWILVRRDHFGSDIGQAIFYKFATGAEPSSYTWSFKKSDNTVLQVRAAGGIIAYSGIDPENPIVDSSGDAGDGIVLTAPGITAEAKSMLVAFYSHKKLTTLSNPAGMVDLYHVQHSNESGPTIRASEELRDVAGATGPRVSAADPVVGSDKWVAQLVGLRAAPTVTVNKVVVNDAVEDPEDDPGLFDLQVNGVTRAADAGHGDGTGQISVASGSSVTVGEVAGTDTDLDDYVSEVSCDNDKGSSEGTSHTFTINSGEDVICTITNTRKAVLTVTKILVPDTDDGRFNLEIDGETAGTGADVGDGGTTGPVKLAPGEHTVSESGAGDTDLADYLVEIGGDCAEDGTITLTSGQEASCTITNTRMAVLTVTKDLVPSTDDGTFDLEIDGETAGTGGGVGDGGTTGPVTLAPGLHTVSESGAGDTDLDDYEVEIGGDCAEDGTITLAAGQVASCTITNTREVAGFAFYLHNRSTQPSGNTTSLANLPMDGAPPENEGSLPNYDTNSDAFAGRLIQKNSPSAGQADLTKYQNWVSPAFGAAFVIDKSMNAEVKIWTAMKDLNTVKDGRVRIYIRDCPGTPQTGCVLIGQADYNRPDGGAFSAATVSVPWTFVGTSYTVAAGHVLEVKVVVRDTSEDDMWFGYDTEAMPAWFLYPQP